MAIVITADGQLIDTEAQNIGGGSFPTGSRGSVPRGNPATDTRSANLSSILPSTPIRTQGASPGQGVTPVPQRSALEIFSDSFFNPAQINRPIIPGAGRQTLPGFNPPQLPGAPNLTPGPLPPVASPGTGAGNSGTGGGLQDLLGALIGGGLTVGGLASNLGLLPDFGDSSGGGGSGGRSTGAPPIPPGLSNLISGGKGAGGISAPTGPPTAPFGGGAAPPLPSPLGLGGRAAGGVTGLSGGGLLAGGKGGLGGRALGSGAQASVGGIGPVAGALGGLSLIAALHALSTGRDTGNVAQNINASFGNQFSSGGQGSPVDVLTRDVGSFQNPEIAALLNPEVQAFIAANQGLLQNAARQSEARRELSPAMQQQLTDAFTGAGVSQVTRDQARSVGNAGAQLSPKVIAAGLAQQQAIQASLARNPERENAARDRGSIAFRRASPQGADLRSGR